MIQLFLYQVKWAENLKYKSSDFLSFLLLYKNYTYFVYKSPLGMQDIKERIVLSAL